MTESSEQQVPQDKQQEDSDDMNESYTRLIEQVTNGGLGGPSPEEENAE